MSSTILIRRSSTAGSVPTTAQLTAGELAINLADKKIYTNTGSSIIELGTIASTMDVEGALGVDGDFDVNTNKFTVASGTGNTSVAGTLDVTGNTQVDGDFTVLGAISIEEPTANSHAATKFYVDQAVTDLIGTAGSALDTLGELADALNDDANFSATVTSSLATKLNLAGGTMTGNIVMGANKVTSTATPTADDDLTRKGYIDALYGSTASAAASATAAETAETNAETARDAAQTAQTAAETAETNAASSASSASTSATNASNSASAASTSATSASNSASSASTSASNAATSATNAENAYDNFDDRYLGAKASDPTVDNDGDALITGAMYFDSSNNVMKVYSGTEWQNASSSIEGIKSDFVYTATASQTLFSGSDDNTNTLVIDKAGLVNVYLNGVRLTDADYTIDAPSNSVTLGSGATVNDIVEIEVFGNFAGQSGADVAITGGSITGLTELSTATFTSTGIDDNATSTAITIDASENVGIGTSSPERPLHISSVTPYIVFDETDASQKFSIGSGGGKFFLYDETDSAQRLTVDTSGNVGIGTDSPNAQLHIGGEANGKLRVDTTSNGFLDLSMYSNGAFIGTSEAEVLRLGTNNIERARIDSSGNLLVGKTSIGSTSDGFEARASGYNAMSDTSGACLNLNRNTTDGDIQTFTKDGSTVGSIKSAFGYTQIVGGSSSFGSGLAFYNAKVNPLGVSGAASDGGVDLGASDSRFKDLYLSGGVTAGSSSSQIVFSGNVGSTPTAVMSQFSSSMSVGYGSTTGLNMGAGAIVAVTGSTLGSGKDNAVDLGAPTTRFKDLYLSGGVYLGGTGSANKLDDYEEGTWTPVYDTTGTGFASITMDASSATYTKVGNLVNVKALIRTDELTLGSASGAVILSGLPFAANGGFGSTATFVYRSGFVNAPMGGYVQSGGTYIVLRKSTGVTADSAGVPPSDLFTGTSENKNYVMMDMTYQV